MNYDFREVREDVRMRNLLEPLLSKMVLLRLALECQVLNLCTSVKLAQIIASTNYRWR
jgi:hypothetical protein